MCCWIASYLEPGRGSQAPKLIKRLLDAVSCGVLGAWSLGGNTHEVGTLTHDHTVFVRMQRGGRGRAGCIVLRHILLPHYEHVSSCSVTHGIRLQRRGEFTQVGTPVVCRRPIPPSRKWAGIADGQAGAAGKDAAGQGCLCITRGGCPVRLAACSRPQDACWRWRGRCWP